MSADDEDGPILKESTSNTQDFYTVVS